MARLMQVGCLSLSLLGPLFTHAVAQDQQAPAAQTEAAQDKTPTTAPTNNATDTAPARLHVYRQRRFAGSALSPSIIVDDKQVVRIGNGRRATIKLSPGTHTVRSDDKSSAISVDAKSGQEYFVRIDEETGFWKGHGKLTMLLPEQGNAEYRLQKPVEEDRKMAKEMIEADAETTADKDDAKPAKK